MLIEQMSHSLLLPQDYLRGIAKISSFLYKNFKIPKRGGGTRKIYHPSKELKGLQRWLLFNIIEPLPLLEEVAFAYRKNINVAVNAQKHVSSKFLLRMDFKDFFPSITDADIRHYINNNHRYFPDWKPDDITFFTSLVCRFGKLTIGAPSSPSLSNALCRHMDVEIKKIAEEYGTAYSRYADDLYFSTSTPNILKELELKISALIKTLDCPANLIINTRKTRHLSSKQKRQVTGIILTSDQKISLGRPLKRRIKSLIYKVNSLPPDERKKLAGLLAYSKSIEPDFINKLIIN